MVKMLFQTQLFSDWTTFKYTFAIICIIINIFTTKKKDSNKIMKWTTKIYYVTFWQFNYQFQFLLVYPPPSCAYIG